MKNLIEKLKSDLGETLVEAMASLLIFTLASIGLFSMISSSARINDQADAASTRYYEQMKVAEGATGDPKYSDKSVKIVLSPVDESAFPIDVITFDDVDVYQTAGDDSALYSYFKHVDEGGA